MLLYELADPDLVKFVALTSKLKDAVESNKIDVDNFSTDELLEYFSAFDIHLDTEDLYELIQKPPLDSIIKNIQGSSVVFVGSEDSSTAKPDQEHSTDVVKQMAKSAMR